MPNDLDYLLPLRCSVYHRVSCSEGGIFEVTHPYNIILNGLSLKGEIKYRFYSL